MRYPKLPNLMISRAMFCKILYIYMLSRYDESNIVNNEIVNNCVRVYMYFQDRPSVRRNKMMNEETIGLHYIAIGLLLFVYHR